MILPLVVWRSVIKHRKQVKYPWQSQHYSKAQKYHHILWCDTALHPQHMVVENQDLALQPFSEPKTKKGSTKTFLSATKTNSDAMIHFCY